MLRRDGIAGVVCLAISIWFLALTWDLPPPLMVTIGPAFYPRVVLGFMALLSVILIASDVMAWRRREAAAVAASAAPTGPRPNYPLVLASFIAFGAYIALLPELGFRIATFLFMAALQVTLEWPRSWMRWLLVFVVAIATAEICYLVFEDYLSVLLPRGSWSGM